MIKITYTDGSVVVYPKANVIERIGGGVSQLKTSKDGEVVAEIAEGEIQDQSISETPPEEQPDEQAIVAKETQTQGDEGSGPELRGPGVGVDPDGQTHF